MMYFISAAYASSTREMSNNPELYYANGDLVSERYNDFKSSWPRIMFYLLEVN